MRPASVVGRIDPAPAQIAVMSRKVERTVYQTLARFCPSIAARMLYPGRTRTTLPQRFSRHRLCRGPERLESGALPNSSLLKSALHVHDLTQRHHVVVEVRHDP